LCDEGCGGRNETNEAEKPQDHALVCPISHPRLVQQDSS
jgi:hypothetical protein